uniref:ATP synthase F0 subunit 6 n=1 Tax=Nipponacmea moskalevi TaxID=1357978 RepID=UPI00286A70E5|nr:ATP synthase F0 subunit 6 [Nipponacmea moskalevi]WKR34947.1 ATP synthase F0 subunit 6 [Nipponacmea moskalevi]
MPLLKWAWGEAEEKVKESGVILLFVSACTWVAMLIMWQSVPGVFVSISHLCVTASIALPFWSAMVVTSALTCTNDFVASLVPESTPVYLILFMVIVEVFSHFMRPLALCTRLSLTMMAGHILLGLILGNMAELMFDEINLEEAREVVGEFMEYWDYMKTADLDTKEYKEIMALVWESWMILVGGMVRVFMWLGVSAMIILGELAVGALQAYIFFTLLLFFNSQYPRV